MLLEIDYATGFCVDMRCVNIQIASSGLMLVNEDGESKVNLETNCHKFHFIQSIARINVDEIRQIKTAINEINLSNNEDNALICDKSSLIIRSAVHKIEFDAFSDDNAENRKAVRKLLFVVKLILLTRKSLSDLLDKRLSALNES